MFLPIHGSSALHADPHPAEWSTGLSANRRSTSVARHHHGRCDADLGIDLDLFPIHRDVEAIVRHSHALRIKQNRTITGIPSSSPR